MSYIYVLSLKTSLISLQQISLYKVKADCATFSFLPTTEVKLRELPKIRGESRVIKKKT